MSKSAKRSGEFELIAKYFAPLARGEVGALGLTDDAAYLKARVGHDLVVTTDAIVAGVHFLPDDPPASVAQKVLRVNVSDLAAKGAVPRAYLLTLALPAEVDDSWVKAFAGGLKRDQARFGMTLIGGDTTSTPGPLMVNIVALGEVPAGKMITRGGAKPGDDVWVSGTIGDAFLGLQALRGVDAGLREAERRAVVARFHVPEPRPTLGARLVSLAHACADVSDGLVADMGHIAEASRVAVNIQGHRVPLSAAAKGALRQGRVALEELLTGGDDYELVFTAPVSARSRVAMLAEAKLPVTRIGTVVRGKGVTVLDADGRPIPITRRGFVHF
jgi:thiamine-monophosphate kinase